MKKERETNEPVLVSIISPVFGRVDLLEATAKSVISQTYSNWEWILVDDGSSEDDFAQITKIAARDPRIILERRARDPKGANTCRNIGVSLARGDHLIFFDSDDILLPHCLKQRVERSVSLNRPCAISAPTIEQAASGEQVIGKQYSGNNGECPLIRMLRNFYPWQTAGVMWPAAQVRQASGWTEKMPRYQDWDFAIRMLLENREVSWLEREDLVFIEHLGPRVSQKNRDYAKDWLAPICANIARIALERHPDDQPVKDAVGNMFIKCLYLIGLDRDLNSARKAIHLFKGFPEIPLPSKAELYLLVLSAGLPRLRTIVPRIFSKIHQGRFYDHFKFLQSSRSTR